jgi:microcystin-dependent protein
MANQIPLAVADVRLNISAPIAVGATSFTLIDANDDDGNALTAGKYCFTVDNGRENKEYLMGQLNGVTVTGVVSVDRQGTETSGAQFAHRVGAEVIITDYATINKLVDVLRGSLNLDGTSPLYYDTEPSLADRKELATVGYVLDTATGGSVSFDTQVITGVNAGEDVVEGNLLYLKESDQEWYLATSDDSDTVSGTQLGIALGAGGNGAGITGGVLLSGLFETVGLTAGSIYYAGLDGAISATPGTNTRVVGVALSTTELLVSNTQKVAPESFSSFVPTGGIIPYAGFTAPTGYLLCDGTAYAISSYKRLCSLMLGYYGISDSLTFTSSFATSTLTSVTHGLNDGEAVFLESSTDDLPDGLSPNTIYYIVNSETNTFQFSTSSGGSPVTLSDDGTGTLTLYKKFKVPDLRSSFPMGYGQREHLISFTSTDVDIATDTITLTTGSLPVWVITGTAMLVDSTTGAVPTTQLTDGVEAFTIDASGNITGAAAAQIQAVGDTFYVASQSSTNLSAATTYYVISCTPGSTFTVSTTPGGSIAGANNSGTGTGNRTNARTYYIIRVSDTSFKLAFSQDNAVVGTAMDITGTGSGDTVFSAILSSRTLGEAGGEEEHTLTVAEMPPHTHAHQAFTQSSSGAALTVGATDGTSTQDTTPQTGSAGGGGSHNTIPPFTVVNYIIKY